MLRCKNFLSWSCCLQSFKLLLNFIKKTWPVVQFKCFFVLSLLFANFAVIFKIKRTDQYWSYLIWIRLWHNSSDKGQIGQLSWVPETRQAQNCQQNIQYGNTHNHSFKNQQVPILQFNVKSSLWYRHCRLQRNFESRISNPRKFYQSFKSCVCPSKEWLSAPLKPGWVPSVWDVQSR